MGPERRGLAEAVLQLRHYVDLPEAERRNQDEESPGLNIPPNQR